jgi:hypothetical protein
MMFLDSMLSTSSSASALLDVAVQFAVLGDRVAPEFTAAAGFLTDFQLDTLFLFVTWVIA